MESDVSRVDGSNYKEPGNSFDLDNSGTHQCGPGNIANIEAVSIIGGGDGNEDAVDSSCVVGERPAMPNEGSMELVKSTESAVAGTGTGTRTKKVMIKTMRIVKKVIKKRVPKRVLKVKDGIDSSEVRINANVAGNANDKSDVVDGVTKKTGTANEAEDTISTADDLPENLNLINDVDIVEKPVHDLLEEEDIRAEVPRNLEINAPNVSGPVISDGVDDLSAQMESEMSETVTAASLTEQIVPRNDESGSYSMDADNIKGNDAVCEVDMNDSTKCSRDLEVDKANFTQGTVTQRENTLMGNQLENCLMLTEESAGPVGEESGVLCGEENEMSIVKAVSCSVEGESSRTRLREGLILSGEMEALERKGNRRTEIFIGGLSKDTREEDIREAFGDVGSVVEVRIVVNPKTRKSRGFAFVQFATAVDAKNALVKYPEVKIRGNLCNAALVEGNDTIFLGNLDRKWKTEDILQLLEKAGIEKIDKVTLKADPRNTERNRGFAFLELQTSKDAQTAFNKLQNKDVFGKNQMVKVAWAEPLNEPAEEEISQVKSVYAEFLPSTWNEEKVKEYFKRFGKIESVVLAKDLLSSRRKDFAFINYTTRDAALTCIESVNRERSGDHCSKAKMAVSLAKPIPERKQMGHTLNPTSRHLEAKENTFQTSKKEHGPRNKGKVASSSYKYNHVKVVNRPSATSTTEELVQLLRQQALTKHNPPHQVSGVSMQDHCSPLLGSKRPFSRVAHDSLHVESQGMSRVRAESSYHFSGASSLPNGVDLSHPPYHHQPGPGHPSESIDGRRNYSSSFQTRNGNGSSHSNGSNLDHRHREGNWS